MEDVESAYREGYEAGFEDGDVRPPSRPVYEENGRWLTSATHRYWQENLAAPVDAARHHALFGDWTKPAPVDAAPECKWCSPSDGRHERHCIYAGAAQGHLDSFVRGIEVGRIITDDDVKTFARIALALSMGTKHHQQARDAAQGERAPDAWRVRRIGRTSGQWGAWQYVEKLQFALAFADGRGPDEAQIEPLYAAFPPAAETGEGTEEADDDGEDENLYDTFEVPDLTKRMIVCPQCGNKRCPHNCDERNPCTGSNESGQPHEFHGDGLYCWAPDMTAAETARECER